MNLKIQSLHFDASQALKNFIEERAAKLTQLYDGIIAVEVTLRLENASETDNKFAEIRLSIPGADLFAKKHSKSFEESVDLVCDALKKQISKHKEKVRGV